MLKKLLIIYCAVLIILSLCYCANASEYYFIKLNDYPAIHRLTVFEKHGCIWKVSISGHPYTIYINVSEYTIYASDGHEVTCRDG